MADSGATKPRRAKGLGGGPYPVKDERGKTKGYIGFHDAGTKPDGRRDRRKVTGKTKREVEEKLESLRRQQHDGTLPDPSRETVKAYLDRWLTRIHPLMKKERSWVFYSDNVRLYLAPHLGNVLLTKLTTGRVNLMCEALLTRQPRPLSARTVVGIRATVRKALADAVKYGPLKVNVAEWSDRPETEQYAPVILEEDELRVFEAAAGGHPLAALFLLLSTTGCRIGEIMAVRERDLDPANDDLRIEVKVRTRGGAVLEAPKSRRGVRTVPLLPYVYAAVQGYLADHEFERRRNAEERAIVQREYGVPPDTLFTRPNGLWLSYTHIERELRKVFGTTALPRLTAHGFRHSNGTNLEQRGVDPKGLAEHLGHADAGFTLRTYVHGNQAMRRRVKAETQAISGR